jgi:DNA primase
MGTALTDRQVGLIRRFSGRATVLFDGDDAGRAAARKAVQVMIAGGIDGKVAALPTGVDPDSLLVEQGEEAMRTILDRGVEGLDYLMADLQASHDNTVLGKVKVVDKIAPLIGSLDDSVARDLYVDRLSMALEVDRGSIVRAVRGSTQPRRSEPDRQSREKREVTPLENDGLAILAILIENPTLFPRAEQGNIKSLLTNADLRATYSAAAEMQAATGQVETARLLQVTAPEIRDAVAEAIMSGGFASAKDPIRALDDCIMALQKRGLRIQLQEIRNQMAGARAEGNIEGLRELGQRLVEVERKIHETR